jgi:hypothetical protein
MRRAAILFVFHKEKFKGQEVLFCALEAWSWLGREVLFCEWLAQDKTHSKNIQNRFFKSRRAGSLLHVFFLGAWGWIWGRVLTLGIEIWCFLSSFGATQSL